MKNSLVRCLVAVAGLLGAGYGVSFGQDPAPVPRAGQAAGPHEQPAASAPALAIAPFDAAQARQHQEEWAKYLGVPVEVTNSIGMKLVLIPPGEFMMGSPETEADRGDASFRAMPRLRRDIFMQGWPGVKPSNPLEQDFEYQHRVRITKAFYFGVFEVTQSEYQRVMGTNPSSFSEGGERGGSVSALDTSRFPMERISWEDAVDFCRKLTFLDSERIQGTAYRLPTEAEWEYACRAGTESAFHVGATMNAQQENCDGNYPLPGRSLNRTTTVGTFQPNAFGLFDMLGNVAEWCQDRYADGYYKVSPIDNPEGPSESIYRVIRGGSWSVQLRYCRSAYRLGREPSLKALNVGFRVVTVLPAQVSCR